MNGKVDSGASESGDNDSSCSLDEDECFRFLSGTTDCDSGEETVADNAVGTMILWLFSMSSLEETVVVILFGAVTVVVDVLVVIVVVVVVDGVDECSLACRSLLLFMISSNEGPIHLKAVCFLPSFTLHF